jgi:hypothetical protein
LAQLLGHDLGPLPELEADAESFSTDAIAALRSDLTDHILPALEDPEAKRRATSGLEYLSHLEAAERYGQAIRIADANERAALPAGLADPDATDWTRAAAATADDQGRTDMAAFLRFAMRRGGRHAYLWPTTLERARDSRWIDGALPLED